MKSNTKKEIVLIIAILFIIIGFRYEQYVVERNFMLDVNVNCIEGEKGCFVADCDPADSEDCDTTHYKKVSILASEAPKCLEEHSCEAFSCSGLHNCAVVLCNDESLEEGEVCVPEDVGQGEVAPQDAEPSASATTTEEIISQ